MHSPINALLYDYRRAPNGCPAWSRELRTAPTPSAGSALRADYAAHPCQHHRLGDGERF